MRANKFGSAKEIQNFQKDCSCQPKWKSIFCPMLTKVMSTVLFFLTSVHSLLQTLFQSPSSKMKKLPDWIISWLWVKNSILKKDKKTMYACKMKDDWDKEVVLTRTIWKFSKLFPMMMLHQTQNCSANQLSHPGWGSRFGSGCPGTINAGSRLLEHNREAVIPTMC